MNECNHLYLVRTSLHLLDDAIFAEHIGLGLAISVDHSASFNEKSPSVSLRWQTEFLNLQIHLHLPCFSHAQTMTGKGSL